MTLRSRRKENATRVELRSPDPACNPYLAFSAILAAGLEGIESNYPIVDPVERNVYNLDDRERRKLKIGTLPEDLFEAIKAMERSEVMKKALGDHVFHSLLENKKLEFFWDSVNLQWLSDPQQTNMFSCSTNTYSRKIKS